MFKRPCSCLGWGSYNLCGAPGTKGHKQGLPLCCRRAAMGLLAEGRCGADAALQSPSPWCPFPPGPLPFLGLVDDVADLHVESPVLALQGAIGSFL